MRRGNCQRSIKRQSNVYHHNFTSILLYMYTCILVYLYTCIVHCTHICSQSDNNYAKRSHQLNRDTQKTVGVRQLVQISRRTETLKHFLAELHNCLMIILLSTSSSPSPSPSPSTPTSTSTSSTSSSPSPSSSPSSSSSPS